MGVKPYSTIATAVDMPFKIMIDQPVNEKYDVSVMHDSTVVKSITGVSGQTIVDIGTPQDLGLAPGSIDKVTVTISRAGSVIDSKTIPVAYVNGSYAVLLFRDENNVELIGDVVVADLKNNTILAYHGSNIGIPANTGNIFDYSMMYVEFSAFKNNVKYYYLMRIDKLSLQSGRQYVLNLIPRSAVGIKLVFHLDTSALGKWGAFLDWIVDGLGYISSIIINLNIKVWELFPGAIAKAILKLYGLDLPIVSVNYDASNNDLYVKIENDPIPLILIALVVAGLVASAVIAWMIRDIIAEQTEQVRIQEYSKILSQIIQLQQNMADKCAQLYGNNVDNYLKCLQGASNVTNSLTDHSANAFKTADNTVQQQDNTIKQLKDMLILAVGGSIIIAVLSRK